MNITVTGIKMVAYISLTRRKTLLNTKVMFSSKTDQWATPQSFFDKLNSEFNFDLDTCAIPENAKCDRYFTPQDDGLSQDWGGAVSHGAILLMAGK